MAVLNGSAPVGDSSFKADYWPHASAEITRRLRKPGLRTAWQRADSLYNAFLKAASESVSAARKGEDKLARRRLDEMFGTSSELVALLISSSMVELLEALRQREEKLAARFESDFLEAAQIGRFAVRLSDRSVVEADDNLLKLLGQPRDAIIGKQVERLFEPDQFVQIESGVRDLTISARFTVQAKHQSGKSVALEVIVYRQHNDTPLLCGLVVNITRNEGESQQRRLLSTTVELSKQVVLITNRERKIIYANPAFTRITGYPLEEVLGRSPGFLQGPETDPNSVELIKCALKKGESVHAEILNYAKDGHAYWMDISIVPVTDGKGAVTHFVSTQHDITQRKNAEQNMIRMALEDYLTLLPNRRAAEERLKLEWNRARREKGRFGIALADIDRFKLVNDQYGHQTGDLALRHMADILSGNLRGGDWMARWGGEEFLLCFHDLDQRGTLVVAERLRELIKSKPLMLPKGPLPLTISMGISLYSTELGGIDAMLAQADSLLYEAKHSGRDKVVSPARHPARTRNVIWEGSMVQAALHDKRLFPVYQPIVDLGSGRIVAEEALARILSQEGTVVTAHNFIQAAEALNLVASIDKTIAGAAVERFIGSVKRAGRSARYAQFINLSSQFLSNPELVDTLLEHTHALAGQGVETAPNPCNALVIEITERQGGDMVQLRKNLQPLT
ncbi:MAG: diguanylate cyclase, partial [Burkholderiales bacterium]